MNTRVLLTASAAVMGLAGLAGTFMHQEILAASELPSTGLPPLFVQLTGALYIAFAGTNWMARNSTMGGIYNRPLAVGNTMHFVIGALTLAKAVAAGERSAIVVTAAVIYALFAIGFGMVLFGSGIRSGSETTKQR